LRRFTFWRLSPLTRLGAARLIAARRDLPIHIFGDDIAVDDLSVFLFSRHADRRRLWRRQSCAVGTTHLTNLATYTLRERRTGKKLPYAVIAAPVAFHAACATTLRSTLLPVALHI